MPVHIHKAFNANALENVIRLSCSACKEANPVSIGWLDFRRRFYKNHTVALHHPMHRTDISLVQQSDLVKANTEAQVKQMPALPLIEDNPQR
jgi:hypothetical protein